MIILPLASIILAFMLCIITSITDIRENRISNNHLLIFGSIGILLNLVQYIRKTNILWGAYLFNLSLVLVFSLILYILHIWAAGDSKLLIVLGVILPANYCMLSERVIPWSVLIVASSFIISFIYLIFESIWLFAHHQGVVSSKNVKVTLKRFFISYIRNLIYISLVLKIENFFAKEWFNEHGLAVIGINICLILLISSVKVMKKNWLVIAIFAASILFSVISGEWFFDVSRLKYYILVVVVMILRTLISEFNYQTISTSEVKKGMILSSFTTMFMLKSRVKGLPEISHEDMRSRLTADEAAAVVRWGQTKNGLKEVQIVRKTPYAIFILSGLIAYTIAWMVLN